MISKHKVILGVANSDLTGAPQLVQDLRQICLSIETQTGTASRFTVIGSNDNGLQSALGTPLQIDDTDGWSIVTTITARGLVAFDPGALGFRWLNVFRPSASSATIIMTGRT